MQSWLRGHGRLSAAAAGRLVRTGRALEYLPAVAAAFADGRVTAEQVALIAPISREEHRAAAAAQDMDLAAVDPALADVAATRPPAELAQVVHHYLARLDPDGPEPDPTERRSLSFARHADGWVTGRFELDPVGGEKVQAVLESMVQANRPPGTPAPAPSGSGTRSCSGPTTPWPPATCRSCAPSNHTWPSPSRSPTWSTRTPAPGRRPPASAPRSPPPGPACSPATARSPGSSSDRKGGRWSWAAPTGWCHPTCGGRSRSATGTACSPAASRRRTGATSTTCRTGSTVARPASTTPRCSARPPHQGPPRIPGRTTTRRPMAHLAARRHRDPAAPPPARRLTTPRPGRPGPRFAWRGRRAALGGASTRREKRAPDEPGEESADNPAGNSARSAPAASASSPATSSASRRSGRARRRRCSPSPPAATPSPSCRPAPGRRRSTRSPVHCWTARSSSSPR